jgi:uncharacterized membrane protein YoaK (UPF0700 family)
MNPTPSRVIAALLALTFVTGLIDAASVLGLGHVFVANMTGNIVFLGFSLLGQGSVSLFGVLLALAGFLLGALLGGRLSRAAQPRGVRLGFALEVSLLAVAAGAACLGAPSTVIIVTLSAAMGQRTALVRSLAVLDVTTTVLTLTLTGIAADSSFAGGGNPRLTRRVASVVVMLLGAALGALLQAHARITVIPTAALIELVGAFALVTAQPSFDTPHPSRSP